MKRGLLLAAAIVLLAIAVFAFRAANVAPAQAGNQPRPAPVVPAKAGTQVPNAPISRETPLDLTHELATTSLRGTQRDGHYRFDARGRLVLDADLVRAFDWFLSLTGELPDARIRALLLADARAQHGDAAIVPIEAAFDRYLGLRAQLSNSALASDLATRHDQVRAARRAWFGDDADAMFGADEAQVAFTLERQRIEAGVIDPAERAAQLEALDAAHPARRTAVRDATGAHLADEQTRQLASSDAATRREERAQLWGSAAADRLAALDAQRASWDRRVAAYLQQRETLGHAEALRRGGFTPEERARIEALDAIGQLAPAGG